MWYNFLRYLFIYRDTAGWCLRFIDFAGSTHLATQIYGGSIAKYVLGPIPLLNYWTHVVQTWSSAYGLGLYIDGVLSVQDSTVTSCGASSVAKYLKLASTLQALLYLANGWSTTGVLEGLGYFNGLVDEMRVCSRESNALEVCALAKYWVFKQRIDLNQINN